MSLTQNDSPKPSMCLACSACGKDVVVGQEMKGRPVECKACGEFMIAPKTRFGRHVVVGDFVLGEVIARGGMGVVFKGYQRSLDRSCAVKVLHAQGKDGVSDELMAEARMAAKLNHPNIIQCYAVGDEDGVCYYAMEYVEGKTLRQMLNDRWKLPPSQALVISRQVILALDFAWKKSRLVHRDIKPENVMIAEDGVVKLADFGLAAPVSELEHEGKEFMRGSPHFMCPEVVLGSEMDYRGDIYSLGAVIYMAVTGKYPLVGDSPEQTAVKHVEEYPPSPATHTPELPKQVVDLIEQMMEKQPEDRFADFDTLLSRLDAALACCPETTVTGGTTTVNLFRYPGGGRPAGAATPTPAATPKPQLRVVRSADGIEIGKAEPRPEPEAEHAARKSALTLALMVTGLFLLIGCGVLWAYQDQVRAMIQPAAPKAVPTTRSSTVHSEPAPRVVAWKRQPVALEEGLLRYKPIAGLMGELALTVRPELTSVVEAFLKVEKGVTLVPGSAGGKLWMVRQPPPGDLAVGFAAAAVYVSPDNPLAEQGISLTQLSALFGYDQRAPGPMPAWGSIGLPEPWGTRLVETMGLPDASIPAFVFRQVVLAGQEGRTSLHTVADEEEMGTLLVAEPGAIGVGEPGHEVDGKMRSVPVQGKATTTWRSDVLQGEYPLGQMVVFSAGPKPGALQKALARFLTSKEGQEAIVAAGFFPLTANEALGGWVESPLCDLRLAAVSGWQAVAGAEESLGVGPLKAKAAESAKRAEGLRAEGDYVAALDAYRALEQQIELVSQQIARRERVVRSQNVVAALAQSAREAKAEQAAPELMGNAYASTKQAERFLAAGDLQAASAQFDKAASDYGHAWVRSGEAAFSQAVTPAELALLKEHGGAQWMAVQTHQQAALAAVMQGSYQDAVSHWRQALEGLEVARKAALADALEGAQAFEDKGQIAVALSFLEKVLTLEPEHQLAKASWVRLRSNSRFKAGETRSNSVGMRFAFIPPGHFLMGSPEEEPARDQDEALHPVDIKKGFFMGQYEVSQMEWDRVMGKDYKPIQGVHPNDLQRGFTAPNMPKHTITWEEAALFCERLTKMTGIPHRLPTEAEWEYACRAGDSAAYHTGKGVLQPGQANVYLPTGATGDGPMAVGSFELANKWGLYDMHGNVWEWCADWEGPYPDKLTVDPVGPQDVGRVDLAKKILRGGSWYDDADKARAANRWGNMPSVGANYIGFRVVMEAAQVE